MNAFFKKIQQLPSNTLILGLSLIGVLIAAQINYIQHGWINNDSVLYFEAARLFAAGEWRQGYSIFPWPLYSALIALVHKLTSLNLHLSAQVLNVMFFGVATASFLKFIQEAGGGNKVLLTGSLILFSSQYVVGDVLQMLMRDEGFWAFFLASLVFFIRFYKKNHLIDALMWQLTIIVAMLFRIEAISYLVFMPLTLLFKDGMLYKDRFNALLKCNSLNILAACAISIALVIFNDFSISHLGRLREVLTLNFYSELTQKLVTKSELMGTQVLGPFLDDFAVEALLLTFLFVMIAKTVSTAGWITTTLALLAIKSRRHLINFESWSILKAAILIAILNMFLIITKVFVLSGRYVVALALLLMILASFYLAYKLKYYKTQNKQEQVKKWILILILIVMTLGLIKNILPKREGYNYQQDAVSWLHANNPERSLVFFDDSRVRHYAGEPFMGTWQNNWGKVTDAIASGKIHEYEFLLISENEDTPEHESYLAQNLHAFKIVHRSSNPKGKKSIVVYKRSP